jgi:hypothetical protein
MSDSYFRAENLAALVDCQTGKLETVLAWHIFKEPSDVQVNEV